MTVEELVALAQRARASKHWRWLPGMLDTHGCRHTGTDPDGLRFWSYGDTVVRCKESVVALPDLSDPATLGCIEHALLPTAWGRGHIQTHWTTEGDGSVYVHDGSASMRWCIEQVSKAEALVAALEAAP